MTRTKSRMLKIQCSGCGAILYGSKQSLRAALPMKCSCGGQFVIPHDDDREVIGVIKRPEAKPLRRKAKASRKIKLVELTGRNGAFVKGVTVGPKLEDLYLAATGKTEVPEHDPAFGRLAA